MLIAVIPTKPGLEPREDTFWMAAAESPQQTQSTSLQVLNSICFSTCPSEYLHRKEVGLGRNRQGDRQSCGQRRARTIKVNDDGEVAHDMLRLISFESHSKAQNGQSRSSFEWIHNLQKYFYISNNTISTSDIHSCQRARPFRLVVCVCVRMCSLLGGLKVEHRNCSRRWIKYIWTVKMGCEQWLLHKVVMPPKTSEVNVKSRASLNMVLRMIWIKCACLTRKTSVFAMSVLIFCVCHSFVKCACVWCVIHN